MDFRCDYFNMFKVTFEANDVMKEMVGYMRSDGVAYFNVGYDPVELHDRYGKTLTLNPSGVAFAVEDVDGGINEDGEIGRCDTRSFKPIEIREGIIRAVKALKLPKVLIGTLDMAIAYPDLVVVPVSHRNYVDRFFSFRTEKSK